MKVTVTFFSPCGGRQIVVSTLEVLEPTLEVIGVVVFEGEDVPSEEVVDEAPVPFEPPMHPRDAIRRITMNSVRAFVFLNFTTAHRLPKLFIALTQRF